MSQGFHRRIAMMSVVGFDDLPLTGPAEPALTTVRNR
jgi:DNA-binding LacI/PurR family transcriptional regulator